MKPVPPRPTHHESRGFPPIPPVTVQGMLQMKQGVSSVDSGAEEVSDLVKNSVLYKEFLAEREEILRHKWLESEKAGHDIGFEKALLDWIVKHRSAWREKRQREHVN